MEVDVVGVEVLCFVKKGFAFESPVLGGKQMAFVDLALFDDRTPFSYLPVLACNLFLGAYPCACFVKEYACFLSSTFP